MVEVRRQGSKRSWLHAHGEATYKKFIEMEIIFGTDRMNRLTRTCQTTRISKIQLNLHIKHVLYDIKLTT